MVKPSQVIQKIEEARKEIEVMPTGFASLDRFLDGGFMRKEFIVIGAGTGVGKSYIAGQMQYNIAANGFKSAFFSLEISNEMVVSRLIGGRANIKPIRILIGDLTPMEMEEKLKAETRIIAHEKYLDFNDSLYEFDELKQAITENNYDFVVIDFLQNIEFLKAVDENTQLKKISRDFQKLAKAQNCCILALSQLSNATAKEKAEKSSNVEFRGSGAIAHAADLAFFIERGDIVGDRQKFSLFLKKNRRGPKDKTFDFSFQIPGGYIREV
jgi:replicative DNA helicase